MNRPLVSFFVLLALGALVYGLYSTAFGFGISFDDEWNLERLGAVTDLRSAIDFVFGGVAGPLGRPLALLTFLPRSGSWPANPEDFLYENALLHVLNTVLVYWLCLRLARYLDWTRDRAPAFALLCAAFWGLSPLLMSSSLMIIQRMTTFSATWCLVGMLLYLFGRERLVERPWRAALLMSAGVGGGTLLAVLSKENGALLPGFVLLVESLLLARVAGSAGGRWWALWRALFLWVPTLLILTYLLVNLGDFVTQHQMRSFTLTERLMTQARVLFDYLRLLIVPVRSDLGPFHDAYPVSTGLLEPATTLVAIIALPAISAAAWWLRRGAGRVFAFAWFWFLWGHVLESSVVPLELYFEHRNYLPAFGVYFGLAALLLHPAILRPARIGIGAILLANSAWVLREHALLWGQPLVASTVWHYEHPESLRAFQLHLNKLAASGRGQQLLDVLDEAEAVHGDTPEYQMIRLAIVCNQPAAADIFARAERTLASRPLHHVVTQSLDRMADRAEAGSCTQITEARVRRLLNAILANEHPQLRPDTLAQAHEVLARLDAADRDFDNTMHHLERAFALRPTVSVGITMASILTAEGRYDEAEQKLDALASHRPWRPVARQRWQESVDEMYEIIERTRRARSDP